MQTKFFKKILLNLMNENDIEEISHLDLYEILDISNDFSESKLKKNYKKLVLKLHPDKPGGDNDAFELVNLAWSILKNSKMRKIYIKKRKEYLDSRDFNCLKYNKEDISTNIPKTEDEAKEKFLKLEMEFNMKHNFNSLDVDVISSSELKKRMDKLQFSRNNLEENYKKNVKKVNLNKNDFNEMFIQESNIEIKNNEIIAFNGNDNILTNYTPINSNNLYAESGSSSKNYSSLDDAFSSNLPLNVTNSYSSHNNIDENDKRKYDSQMAYHLNSINNSNNFFN